MDHVIFDLSIDFSWQAIGFLGNAHSIKLNFDQLWWGWVAPIGLTFKMINWNLFTGVVVDFKSYWDWYQRLILVLQTFFYGLLLPAKGGYFGLIETIISSDKSNMKTFSSVIRRTNKRAKLIGVLQKLIVKCELLFSAKLPIDDHCFAKVGIELRKHKISGVFFGTVVSVSTNTQTSLGRRMWHFWAAKVVNRWLKLIAVDFCRPVFWTAPNGRQRIFCASAICHCCHYSIGSHLDQRVGGLGELICYLWHTFQIRSTTLHFLLGFYNALIVMMR